MLYLLDTLLDGANMETVETFAGIERGLIGSVLNIIRTFGTGIALIMLTWMSISYFSADGRGAPWAAERKADVKGKQLKNFAIGAAIFIGASNIIYYIVMLSDEIVSEIFS